MDPVPFEHEVVAPPRDPANDTSERSEPSVSFLDRLEAIRQLMASLDLVTRSGQNHVMHKVLILLRREFLRAGLSLTDPRRIAAMRALKELEYEAGRIAPGLVSFNGHARVVVELLCRVGCDRIIAEATAGLAPEAPLTS
jgi:hypothetical protein